MVDHGLCAMLTMVDQTMVQCDHGIPMIGHWCQLPAMIYHGQNVAIWLQTMSETMVWPCFNHGLPCFGNGLFAMGFIWLIGWLVGETTLSWFIWLLFETTQSWFIWMLGGTTLLWFIWLLGETTLLWFIWLLGETTLSWFIWLLGDTTLSWFIWLLGDTTLSWFIWLLDNTNMINVVDW